MNCVFIYFNFLFVLNLNAVMQWNSMIFCLKNETFYFKEDL